MQTSPLSKRVLGILSVLLAVPVLPVIAETYYWEDPATNSHGVTSIEQSTSNDGGVSTTSVSVSQSVSDNSGDGAAQGTSEVAVDPAAIAASIGAQAAQSFADVLGNDTTALQFQPETPVEEHAEIVITESDGNNFYARLEGSQETPSVDTLGWGGGLFRLTEQGLEYKIDVHDLSGPIQDAHFHRGASGVAGPALVSIQFQGGHAEGIIGGFTQEALNELRAGGIYVNVHTAMHPDGEIRGQILGF